MPTRPILVDEAQNYTTQTTHQECVSQIHSHQGIKKNTTRTLLVASFDRHRLNRIAADFGQTPELNIGEMPFNIEAITSITPDVGTPGSCGVLETGTGVHLRIPRQFDDQVEAESAMGNQDTCFWRPNHGLELFEAQLEATLTHKHKLLCSPDLPAPVDRPNPFSISTN